MHACTCQKPAHGSLRLRQVHFTWQHLVCVDFQSPDHYGDGQDYIVEEAARLTNLRKLLGILPVVYLFVGHMNFGGAASMLAIGLTSLKERRSEWDEKLHE